MRHLSVPIRDASALVRPRSHFGPRLTGLYTQRFDRRHERVGHVFQGRFHAVLVEPAREPGLRAYSSLTPDEIVAPFARRVGAHVEDRTDEREIPRPERLVGRESLDVLFSSGVTANRAQRNRRIREASLICGYSLAEIAGYLGLHYSTVSRISAAEPCIGGEPAFEAGKSGIWSAECANSRPDPSVR